MLRAMMEQDDGARMVENVGLEFLGFDANGQLVGQ